MHRAHSFLFVVALAFQIADASPLEGRVRFNDICPDYAALGHSKVILDDGRYSAGIRRDGSFSIPDVAEGSYILNVLSHDYAFDSFRIDVYSPPSNDVSKSDTYNTSSPSPRLPDVRLYIPGTPHNPPSPISLHYPLVLTPRHKAQYFIERQSFNALGMLGNPMVLMMLVTGVLVFGMPYLIKSLDPEMAKEFNERQARISGIQSAVQSGDFRSGLSALLSENDPDTSGSSSAYQSAHSTPRAGSGPGSGSVSSRGKGSKGGRRR